jgi:hypothetical protein
VSLEEIGMEMGLVVVVTVCVVEILTTDGINLSARSANDAGTVFEFD